jgi:hypothetical protein
MTPSGIEPATFRFAAPYLNHCATTVPGRKRVVDKIDLKIIITATKICENIMF